MTKLINCNGEYYRIVAAHNRNADEASVDFLDELDAFCFLRRLAEDEFNRAAIRRFAVEHGFVPAPHPIGDQRLLKYLAANLITGRLQTVRSGEWQWAVTSGSQRPGEAREQEQADDEEAPPPSDEKTWIMFEVVDDETGDPVKGVTLRIKLPDGQMRNATTDGSGMIEITDIPPGTCDIERMIDFDTLEVVAVE
jgi:hypothetical protein